MTLQSSSKLHSNKLTGFWHIRSTFAYSCNFFQVIQAVDFVVDRTVIAKVQSEFANAAFEAGLVEQIFLVLIFDKKFLCRIDGLFARDTFAAVAFFAELSELGDC